MIGNWVGSGIIGTFLVRTAPQKNAHTTPASLAVSRAVRYDLLAKPLSQDASQSKSSVLGDNRKKTQQEEGDYIRGRLL